MVNEMKAEKRSGTNEKGSARPYLIIAYLHQKNAKAAVRVLRTNQDSQHCVHDRRFVVTAIYFAECYMHNGEH